jgi:hypothetical protein
MNSEDRPLSRWSRRKAEARRKRGSAAPAIEEAPQAALPVESPAPEAAEAPPPDLPDVESLTADSDFAQFMKEGVPKQLQKLALRKLWASDPAFNVIDEMVEYGEDFTDGGALIANLKDVLDDGREKARKLSAEEETPEAEPADEAEPPAPEDAAEPPGSDPETAERPGTEDAPPDSKA